MERLVYYDRAELIWDLLKGAPLTVLAISLNDLFSFEVPTVVVLYGLC